MNQSVVSVGATRPLSGSVFGVTMDVRLAIVVEVGKARLTRFAFGSVPVLTDQRSTPHCAKSVCANASSANATVSENNSVRLWCPNLRFFSVSLCVLGVSVVKMAEEKSTTEAQSIHRDTEKNEIRTLLVRFIAILTLADFAESRSPPRPIRQSSGARIIELEKF